jgi:heparan-alpha-glucosaminide N-acetyltransferase
MAPMQATPSADPAPVSPVSNQGERIASVDALRGLVITLMIFVNDAAGVRDLPSWLKHAGSKADAMTLPDVVFPAFLFIAGLSVPLAFARAEAAGCSRTDFFKKALGRTGALLAMGVVMVNLESHNPWPRGAWGVLAYLAMFLAFASVPTKTGSPRTVWRALRLLGGLALAALAIAYTDRHGQHLVLGPLFDATDTQWLRHSWWGILGLIGWAYVVTATLYLWLGRRREWLLASVALLTALYLWSHSDYASRIASREWLAGAAPLLIPVQSFILALNRHVSIGDMFGSLPAIAVAGCCLGTILIPGSEIKSPRERIRWAAIFGAGLALGALLLDPLYGLNKIRATPSWCLLCAALTTGAWIFLYWLMDLRGRRSWSRVFRPAGANPLLAYLIHPFLYLLADMTDLPIDFYKRDDWPLIVNLGGCALMALLVVQLTAVIARTGYRLRA